MHTNKNNAIIYNSKRTAYNNKIVIDKKCNQNNNNNLTIHLTFLDDVSRNRSKF